MDKRARQAEKVRNFGFNYDARKTMSDPKPYTLERFDMDCEMDELSSVAHRDIRATVEALERVRRERDEARHERDVARAIASANGHADLVVQRDRADARAKKAEAERDEETRKRYATEKGLVEMTALATKAERERDALKAALTAETRIALDYQSQRDEEAALRERYWLESETLKAALRDMLKATSDDGLLVETMTAKERDEYRALYEAVSGTSKRDIAERQREACAKAVYRYAVDGVVRATPLVTEGEE